MSYFNSYVSNILLEQQQSPNWYKEVLKKLSDELSETVDNNVPVPAGDLRKTLQMAMQGDTGNVSEQQIAIRFLSVYDLFVQLIETDWKKKNLGPTRPTIDDCIVKMDPADSEISGIIETWLKNQSIFWEEYQPLTRNGIEVKRKTLKNVDSQSRIAITNPSIQRLSIIDAVKEAVRVRTNVINRIGNLKSISQPFTNLITDVFKYPKQYQTGQKKVTSDFAKIVDNLYIQDLIFIADAAKSFFADEIASKKMTPQAAETPNSKDLATNISRGQANQSTTQDGVEIVQASLNLFNNFYNFRLLNEISALTRFNQSTYNLIRLTDPKVRERFKNLREKLKQDQKNYENFISGEKIQYKNLDPNTNQESQKIQEAGPYTIGAIRAIAEKSGPSKDSAKKLIDLLAKILAYTTKGVGAGERLGYAVQTAGAISDFAGASLYGGPR